MELKDQRAARIEEIKKAMLVMVRKNDPTVGPDMQVELTPDAAIDLFGLGIMDSPEVEFEEFLTALRQGTPVPVSGTDD